MNLHPNYLSKIFRDSFDMTPKQYLMQLKMSKAAYLLSTMDMPISAIAASLGFDDQLTFSKAFKQYYGSSPSEYRRDNFLNKFK